MPITQELPELSDFYQDLWGVGEGSGRQEDVSTSGREENVSTSGPEEDVSSYGREEDISSYGREDDVSSYTDYGHYEPRHYSLCSRWIDLNHRFSDSYVIAIIVQLSFSVVYAVIYAIFFSNRDSVTKMHMFVLYINTSCWGWVIYVFFYLVACKGPIDQTPLIITALVFLGIFGLTGCIEMCCSREGGYFRHQKTMSECVQYMSDMKATAPIHQIYIECYHYVTEYHTTTDSNGNTKTTTTRRRVTTDWETRNFPYDRWTDESDYPNLPEISMDKPIVAVDSTYIVAPGDDYTLNKFDIFRSNFLADMRRRDDYIDETIKTIIPGHLEQVTAKSEKEGEVPWWLDEGLFYFLAMLFCSFPLRVLFRSMAKKHTFQVRKLYFVDPLGFIISNRGVNVTVNVVDNEGTVNIDTDPDGIPMQEYSVAPIKGQQAPPGYQTVPTSSPQMPPPPYNPNM